jgi:hypothetical protein
VIGIPRNPHFTQEQAGGFESHACGVDDVEYHSLPAVPNPVPRKDNFKRALVVNFCLAPRQAGKPYIDAALFKAALNTFRGKEVKGGFKEDDPPHGGFGEWVQEVLRGGLFQGDCDELGQDICVHNRALAEYHRNIPLFELQVARTTIIGPPNHVAIHYWGKSMPMNDKGRL